MKQKQFTEMIAALHQGDIIRVFSTELEQEITEENYEATVMGVERVDSFGFKSLLNIASLPELVWTKRFDLSHRFELLSWQQKPAVSVYAENLEPGDILTCWEHDILVQDVIPQISHCLLYTKDLVTGEERCEHPKMSDRYLYKLRELNEEEVRAISEGMLPPMTSQENESPEQVANRVVRHIQEWT